MFALPGRLRSFCESTSCHGFPQLANSRHLGGKIFWTFLIISLTSVLTWNTGNVIKNYFDSKARWTTSISEEYFSSLPHPRLVICNHNKYRKSSLVENKIPRNITILMLSRINTTRGLYTANVSDIDNADEWGKLPGIPEGLSVFDVFDRMGHFCEQTIKMIRTSLDGQQLEEIVDPCNSTDVKIRNVKPLDVGHMCVKVQLVAKNHMLTNGPNYGTTFLLDVEPDEYLDIVAGNSHDVGLLVQMTSDKKIIQGNWINLSPGFHTWIGMNRVEHRPGEAFDSLFKPPCIIKPIMTWNHDIYYTKELCSYDCHLIPLINKCGCYNVDTRKIRSCMSAQEWACLHGPLPAVTTLDKKAISACLKTCGEPCSKSSIRSTSTYSQFPSQTQLSELQHHLPQVFANNSIEQIRKRYVLLDVFYSSGDVTVIEWRLRNSVGILLGNLGGQMGLFLGMSIISIVHAFIHFCVQPLANKKAQVKPSEKPKSRERKLSI